jgi:hypothetical protein
MIDQNSTSNFISVQTFDAVYTDQQNDQTLILELRYKANRTSLLFTTFNNKQIYSNSIQDFVLKQSNCFSLSIPHNLTVLWDDILKEAQLIETYIPNHEDMSVNVKVSLFVEGNMYESTTCVSLTEAMLDLYDVIGSNVSWWMQTCFHCKYSNVAFLDPTDDRNELRCYRDVPEAFTEIQQKHKFASSAAFYAGDYNVSAFHRCAAWQHSSSLEE